MNMETVAFGVDPVEGTLLVGQVAIEAYEERQMELGAKTVVPLRDILISPEPYDGQKCVTRRHEWTREDMILTGQWLLSIVQEGDTNKRVMTSHLRRLSEIGLAPATATILRRFDSKISTYRQAIGSPVNNAKGLFDSWQAHDYTAHARRIYRDIVRTEGSGRRLKETDYHTAFLADTGPSFKTIERKIGAENLNDHLGYAPIRSWDKDDYIAWGARLFRVNGPIVNLKLALQTLSKSKRGPGFVAVLNKFGSMEHFRDESMATLERQQAARQERLDMCLKFVAHGHLTEDLLELPESDLLAVGARHRLITYYSDAVRYPDNLSSHIQRGLLNIQGGDTFLRALARSSTSVITVGDVESTASMLGVYDDIIRPGDDSYLRLA